MCSKCAQTVKAVIVFQANTHYWSGCDPNEEQKEKKKKLKSFEKEYEKYYSQSKWNERWEQEELDKERFFFSPDIFM